MIVFGSEFKLNVHLEPIGGLHMSDYDFECAIFVNPDDKVLIPKDKMKKLDADNYIAVIESEDAEKIGMGRLKVEITAYIPDEDFSDGLRTEKLLICTNQNII